ncbi:MAG TPA: CBS and ACT domain-containing protein [Syntrophomonadaceae bacterium]|nr:CBS and ACT domain-containing protein [Syntrophomonadaceae bacterium]HPR93980.1 CBS and ACT domain-containing protein [Syntrophomonadaceae bacterium]
MKVKDRMTTSVKTVQLDTSVTEAFRMMKDNNIRRLPVLEKDRLVGITTLTDLNQAAPSSATTLSIHELNYLLAKTKIKDILPKKQKVITVTPDTYIETAAKIMRQNKISSLPVIENGKLVGIVTETDIFDALIDILGVKKAHSRIDLYVRERPGTLAEITSIIAESGINILNTVVFYEDKKDRYKIILRLESLENDELIKKLAAKGYEIESVMVRAEEDS